MELVKQHLEENLKSAEKAYDDAFWRYRKANEDLKQLTQDVNNFKLDMEQTLKDVNYYQGLINDLKICKNE